MKQTNQALKQHYLDIRQDSASLWPGPRGEIVNLRSENLEVTVCPEDGARITSIKAFGHEVLRQWTEERRGFQYGIFPMVPWVGRVGGGLLYHEGKTYQLNVNRPPHALHGLSCFKPWGLLNDGTFGDHAAANRCDLEFSLDDVWPWKGSARQTVKVADNYLTVQLTVCSAEGGFPAAAGWHPWFVRWLNQDATTGGSEAELHIPADWQEESGANQLPTGNRIEIQPAPWDNCFGFDHCAYASVIWPGLKMTIESDNRWLTVFTEPEDAFCIEPLTGVPNGVNTLPDVVTPWRPLQITMKLHFEHN